MRIADSLRKECMPEMVWAMCKLAGSGDFNEAGFKRAITMGNAEDYVYNTVYRFACDSGFLVLDGEGKVRSPLSTQALQGFRQFRYEAARQVFLDGDTAFTLIAKWYLRSGTDVFRYKSSDEFASSIPLECGSVQKDDVLGIQFWLTGLGLAAHQSTAHRGSSLVFAAQNLISDWLFFARRFRGGETVQARRFIEALCADLPVFRAAVDGNNILLSLSMALRVLDGSGRLRLEYVMDSMDVWHLSPSVNHRITGEFSQVIVG